MKKISGYACVLMAILFFSCNNKPSTTVNSKDSVKTKSETINSTSQKLDTAKYYQLMKYIANGDTMGRWPVKNQPLPLPGALLPFHRIVAYYGNLQSKKMGALGKWSKDTMIKNLLSEVKKWNDADSVVPSIPALHYIAVTA